MRSLQSTIVVGILAAAAALGTGMPGATARTPLVVKRFLLGRLDPNTDRFLATGTRGTTNAFRDDAILLVFSVPVDPGTVDSRTVRIGIPTSAGLLTEAEGTFYAYSTYALDPISGSYVRKRSYRNRVIFDPTSRFSFGWGDCPAVHGFDANATYTVTIPGLDRGATRTVRTADGSPMVSTFTTTFRTTDSSRNDFEQPSLVGLEGADAPGVGLDGRTAVADGADIVATFSETMLPASFDPASSFSVYNATEGVAVAGTVSPSKDGRSFLFHPDTGYARGPSTIQVTLTRALTDRTGNPLDRGVVATFKGAGR